MPKTNFSLNFYFIFILAISIRLVLLFPQYSGDVKNHLAWAEGFISTPSNFYSQHFAGFNDPNYPPLAIYLFTISLWIYKSLVSLFNYLNQSLSIFPSNVYSWFLHENTKIGFLKLPAVFSDIGLGYLIYCYCKQNSIKNAKLIVSLFLLSPATIYLSTVWGQIEPITLFFIASSLVLLDPVLSIPVFVFAILTKQTALWLLPIFIVIWLKRANIKNFFYGTLLGSIVFFLSYLPFGLTPLLAIQNYLGTLAGSSTVVSDAAWNLWYFFYPLGTNDSVLVGSISIRTISIILLFTSLVVTLYFLAKKYSEKNAIFVLFIWSVIVFFLQTRVHERHLYPALFFFLLLKLKQKPLIIGFIILSVYHYLNLYWSLNLPFI